MSEIPNLKIVYEDDIITLILHDIHEDQSRLVLHAEVVKSTNREVLQHIYTVVETLCESLKDKGFEELEAWVSEPEEIRFAQYFGFNKFVGQLQVNGMDTVPKIYILKRAL